MESKLNKIEIYVQNNGHMKKNRPKIVPVSTKILRSRINNHSCHEHYINSIPLANSNSLVVTLENKYQ